jgi:hypothetical protein
VPQHLSRGVPYSQSPCLLTLLADATSGTILFGGIDTSKFTAPLVTLNLLPTPFQDPQSGADEGEVYEFITTVTALNATVFSQSAEIFSGGIDSTTAYTSDNTALPVLLDTGSAAWQLPQHYYDAIASKFTYVDSQGSCDCKYRSSNDSISVEFGGKITIDVPARQFIIPVYDQQTNQPQYSDNGQQVCAFLLQPAAQGEGMAYQVVGDAVLRSMYVVFDLDNGQVSIAQAALDSTSSPNIKPVGAGLGGVAKAASATDTSVPSNTWSIAAAVSGGETYTASTGSSTVGTATGTDAVPANARASQEGSSSTSASASGSGTTSKAAAVTIGKRSGAGHSDLAVLGLIWVGICMGFGGGVVALA